MLPYSCLIPDCRIDSRPCDSHHQKPVIRPFIVIGLEPESHPVCKGPIVKGCYHERISRLAEFIHVHHELECILAELDILPYIEHYTVEFLSIERLHKFGIEDRDRHYAAPAADKHKFGLALHYHHVPSRTDEPYRDGICHSGLLHLVIIRHLHLYRGSRYLVHSNPYGLLRETVCRFRHIDIGCPVQLIIACQHLRGNLECERQVGCGLTAKTRCQRGLRHLIIRNIQDYA